MGRLLIMVAALLLAGCASTLATSRTATALVTLQMHVRAGVYPGDWTIVGDSHAAYLVTLQQWAAGQGIVVAAAPISNKRLLGHVSHSAYAGWIVLINETLTPNHRLHTLLHELGHVYGPQDLGMDAGEVFAELVAAQVCERVGLNVWPQTTAYLAAFVPLDRQTVTVDAHGGAIDEIVDKLAKAVK